LTNLYEGMFLLDNKVVRQGWKAAKAIVTDMLSKHEANTITARRWDERRLSYSIKGRGRATYMLAYFELSKDAGPALNRSLELNETVLRYLITRVDAIPVTEPELASREESDDFVVPAPPVEDAPAPVAEREAVESTDEPKKAEAEAETPVETPAEKTPEVLEPVVAAATQEPAAEAASTEETKPVETKTEEGA